jgi:hypothetical protein
MEATAAFSESAVKLHEAEQRHATLLAELVLITGALDTATGHPHPNMDAADPSAHPTTHMHPSLEHLPTVFHGTVEPMVGNFQPATKALYQSILLCLTSCVVAWESRNVEMTTQSIGGKAKMSEMVREHSIALNTLQTSSESRVADFGAQVAELQARLVAVEATRVSMQDEIVHLRARIMALTTNSAHVELNTRMEEDLAVFKDEMIWLQSELARAHDALEQCQGSLAKVTFQRDSLQAVHDAAQSTIALLGESQRETAEMHALHVTQLNQALDAAHGQVAEKARHVVLQTQQAERHLATTTETLSDNFERQRLEWHQQMEQLKLQHVDQLATAQLQLDIVTRQAADAEAQGIITFDRLPVLFGEERVDVCVRDLLSHAVLIASLAMHTYACTHEHSTGVIVCVLFSFSYKSTTCCRTRSQSCKTECIRPSFSLATRIRCVGTSGDLEPTGNATIVGAGAAAT